ncbi:MAG: 50S ribosomal protein L6 [Flavobacteriaceae bacterium]|jgi:large subunit ribosomal protein L6|nr:MAG: 50S ribosomal protein L6 [Flavobacteriales bacterium]
MSRIGNSPITIPEGVSVEIQPNLFTVKGKLGELSQSYDLVSIEKSENTLTLKRVNQSKTAKAKHGLYRALFYNMVQGVSNGWSKELELVGVGYRAKNQGQKLELALGFSHNIVFQIPTEVKVETVSEKGKNPIIKLMSLDKQLVGAIASKIRSFRKPEPYKGKGVKYVGEEIRRKAGKSA